MHLLIAHQNEALVSDLLYSFSDESNTVSHGSEIRNALEILQGGGVDFALIGTAFADGSGLDLKRAMSESVDVPTIVLSGEIVAQQAVLYLEYGCDDYMTLPIDILELKARIRAILRRYGSRRSSDSEDYVFARADFLFYLLQGKVYYQGRRIPLTEKEYHLLLYLARQENESVTRKELLQEVWETESVDVRTVDVHIRRIRKKLEAVGAMSVLITCRGEGYRFAVFSAH